MLNDKQEEYPDWGPIFLSAASKAILLNWYRKAQRLRAGKKGAKKRVKEVKQISDDEGIGSLPHSLSQSLAHLFIDHLGDEIPAEWVKNLKSISDSTKTIAIKWMRTARARLQQRKGSHSLTHSLNYLLTSRPSTRQRCFGARSGDRRTHREF